MGIARGRNFMVTAAFSKLREGKCSRAERRELFNQRESRTRPFPAHADCTQRRASAPLRRLYAANRRYHRPSAVKAQTTSMIRRRPTTSSSFAVSLMPMVRLRLRARQGDGTSDLQFLFHDRTKTVENRDRKRDCTIPRAIARLER